MLEELLIDQRLNAGAIGLLLSGVERERAALPVEKVVSRRLSRLFKFDSRLAENTKAIALVGPAGVGKTTTIAKLAMQIRETFALNVGLIATDIHRGGQGFHLHTFATLAGLPCFELPRFGGAQAYQEGLQSLAACDLVLIDTVGDSDASSLEGIECERLLTLAAHWSHDELVHTALRYSAFEASRLVITNIDRCGYSGPLVQGLLEVAKPMAFFGLGERVPNDIEPAAARRLARMLTRTLQ
ncbi:MAG: hypothetical protein J0M12_15110 [Deltaproteobacteria bacterium]|nr:hypothetical protein [Deltaproteobacteria bacterium]